MQQVQNPRVTELVRSAHETMRAGRMDEAVRIWEQVRTLAPQHPQALYHLGRYHLFRKEPAQALVLLEEAALADPKTPAIPMSIAQACRALGNNAQEMAAITRALTIDPYFFPALLAKGMLQERSGQKRAAAKTYNDLITVAPPDAEISLEFRDQMRHAREVVQENAVALEKHLDARLAAIRARHAGENLARFDECQEIAVGTKKHYTQQPSMLLVPRLPAIQFYDDDLFPWLPKLEAATAEIREELQGVLREEAAEFRPYVAHPDGSPINQWKELNHSPRWSTYFLWKDGARLDAPCAKCPKTEAASRAVPVINAENFGPTIMFSQLAPRTTIPPHSSSTNARLVVHLPLIVPEGCRFRVGNETREWREGKAWVFDDTIDHEAWNDSDEFRVILMIDIWNPLLSPAERELVTGLLNGINEYYQEPAGGE